MNCQVGFIASAETSVSTTIDRCTLTALLSGPNANIPGALVDDAVVDAIVVVGIAVAL